MTQITFLQPLAISNGSPLPLPVRHDKILHSRVETLHLPKNSFKYTTEN